MPSKHVKCKMKNRNKPDLELVTQNLIQLVGGLGVECRVVNEFVSLSRVPLDLINWRELLHLKYWWGQHGEISGRYGRSANHDGMHQL